MEKFIVSARKYRPQTFNTVVGQSHITTTLKNAIKHQQLAHAFLFCGPRGVGKTTCARILAKTINCEKPTKEGEACDKCQSCKSFNEGTSMNYFELDAASNNSVDDIRNLVDQVRFVPQTGRYKVYVIDEVHQLTSAAFNAFLKTLEEPPSYAVFILATTEKHKIIPTILSRCQIFDFKRITTDDTVQHLEEICKKEDIKADKAALHVIAQKSEGCMRDALSILDKIVSFTNGELDFKNTLEHLNILDAEFYFKLLVCMQSQNLSAAMLLYDEINKKGFEGDVVLNGFSEFIRNLLVCKDQKAAILLEVVENFRDKYIAAAKEVSSSFLVSSLNILNDAEINYKGARNKRLHVELALIKLCYLKQAIELSTDGGGLSKKKLSDAPVAFRTVGIKKFTPHLETPKNIAAEKPLSKLPEAKLIIETPKTVKTLSEESPTEYNQGAISDSKKISGKLSSLDSIRKQYSSKDNDGNSKTDRPLVIDELQKAWNEYAGQLKTAKNPAAHSFEEAQLNIKDSNSFEVITGDNIEKQFIEHNRNNLFDYLQKKLTNKQLQFLISVSENVDVKPKAEIVLSSKEQFLKIAEIYPMVKELKSRLKLDLDY